MRFDSTRRQIAVFLSRIEVQENGCHFYQGRLGRGGYGYFNMRSRSLGAHRFAYLLAHGEIADHLMVMHTCSKNYPKGDNTYRRCVNPEHLTAGTGSENMQQAILEGRKAVGPDYVFRPLERWDYADPPPLLTEYLPWNDLDALPLSQPRKARLSIKAEPLPDLTPEQWEVTRYWMAELAASRST